MLFLSESGIFFMKETGLFKEVPRHRVAVAQPPDEKAIYPGV